MSEANYVKNMHGGFNVVVNDRMYYNSSGKDRYACVMVNKLNCPGTMTVAGSLKEATMFLFIKLLTIFLRLYISVLDCNYLILCLIVDMFI